jgi:uncharacterized protein YcfL
MKKSLILMLVAALVIVGCSTPKPAPKPILPKAPPDKRVAISPALQNAIQVVKISGAREQGGYYGVHITLQNTTQALVKISYRMKWLDDTGAAVNLPSVSSNPWLLFPGEASALSITSPTPLARDFNMEIFEAGP